MISVSDLIPILFSKRVLCSEICFRVPPSLEAISWSVLPAARRLKSRFSRELNRMSWVMSHYPTSGVSPQPLKVRSAPWAVASDGKITRNMSSEARALGGFRAFFIADVHGPGLTSEMGQNRKSSMRANVFRFAPESGHRAMQSACPFRANNGLVSQQSGGRARPALIPTCPGDFAP